MDTGVFDRTEAEGRIISSTAYNLVIGLTLLWGFAVNWIIVTSISPQAIADINPWIFFIGYFASCFFGVYLFIRILSILGRNRN